METMQTFEEKIKSHINLPALVRDQVAEALRRNGIVDAQLLEKILPDLSKALEVSKAEDGTLNIALTSNGKVLKHEATDKKWSVLDWVSDYVFVDLPKGVEGMEASMRLSDEDLDAVAKGKKVFLPGKRYVAGEGAIPSLDMRGMSKHVDEIASGEQEIDMSR